VQGVGAGADRRPFSIDLVRAPAIIRVIASVYPPAAGTAANCCVYSEA
jgi:hypothetical protein